MFLPGKKMFYEYLIKREKEHGEPFRGFTHAGDYLPHVDGKPRYKGVESFLQSRGITIPFGDPSDAPGTETICGLRNRKNETFNEVIEKEGVEVYESTLNLIYQLLKAEIKLAPYCRSKNSKIRHR